MAPDAQTEELSRDQACLIHSLHQRAAQQHAHVWVEGHGSTLIDADGNEFIDGLAGLWNVVLGHGRRELSDAASTQMSKLAYCTGYTGSTSPRSIELGQRLSALCYSGINRFFFTSGGAESNESAFKTARFYWKTAGAPEKTKFISRVWGYHGVTLAAMSATGIASYWPMFEPRTPGFIHIESPYPYRFERPAHIPSDDPRTDGQIAADLLEEAILREGPETVAGFLAEPVQGAGGVIVPQEDYWPRVREICDRYKVLLMADEVITGFGRTGDWFGLSRYNIEPDIVCYAKGITSGYFPLGGIGVNDTIAEAIDSATGPETWMHAFTYSGHPVGCAVALATIDVLEKEALPARAGVMGERLLQGLRTLESHPHVGDVRGQGLMCAVEFVADKTTKAPFPAEESIGAKIHAATQKRGLFTRLRGDVYNLAPCFTVEEATIDRMVAILGESIDEVLGS